MCALLVGLPDVIVIGLGGDMYGYDSSGRHVLTVGGGTTVSYVRDVSGAIVSRFDSSTGVTVRYSGSAVLDGLNVVVERTVVLPGGVVVTKRAVGDVWSYPNVHGDVVVSADAAGVKQGPTVVYDPFGSPVGGVVPDNGAGSFDFGWVGSNVKGLEHASGVGQVIEMGVRIYQPVLGRFLAVDPVEGGNANDYIYPADPINAFDLDGRNKCEVGLNPWRWIGNTMECTKDAVQYVTCVGADQFCDGNLNVGLGKLPGNGNQSWGSAEVDGFVGGSARLGGRFAKAVYKTSCKVSSAFSLYRLPNAAGAVGINAFRLSKKWLFAITGGAVETSISILKGYSYLGYAATAYDLLCRMPR